MAVAILAQATIPLFLLPWGSSRMCSCCGGAAGRAPPHQDHDHRDLPRQQGSASQESRDPPFVPGPDRTTALSEAPRCLLCLVLRKAPPSLASARWGYPDSHPFPEYGRAASGPEVRRHPERSSPYADWVHRSVSEEFDGTQDDPEDAPHAPSSSSGRIPAPMGPGAPAPVPGVGKGTGPLRSLASSSRSPPVSWAQSDEPLNPAFPMRQHSALLDIELFHQYNPYRSRTDSPTLSFEPVDIDDAIAAFDDDEIEALLDAEIVDQRGSALRSTGPTTTSC